MLLALGAYVTGTLRIILRGEKKELVPWLAEIERDYRPNRFCLSLPTVADELPQPLDLYTAQGKAVAYICHGQGCLPPVTAREDLPSALENY